MYTPTLPLQFCNKVKVIFKTERDVVIAACNIALGHIQFERLIQQITEQHETSSEWYIMAPTEYFSIN